MIVRVELFVDLLRPRLVEAVATNVVVAKYNAVLAVVIVQHNNVTVVFVLITIFQATVEYYS